jgi:hypothetical protein
VKPKSTRTESVELFVVGTGYVPQVVPPDVGGAADEVAL